MCAGAAHSDVGDWKLSSACSTLLGEEEARPSHQRRLGEEVLRT